MPSLDSCTGPATMVTSMAWRAHRRPHAYGVPAKLTTPPPSASRVTLSPLVTSRARRWGDRPRLAVGLVLAQPLGVRGDDHPACTMPASPPATTTSTGSPA
jgi:hypothetical protein